MGRIKEVRHLAYLWRCFGDGIASVYQSQHALSTYCTTISTRSSRLQVLSMVRRVSGTNTQCFRKG